MGRDHSIECPLCETSYGGMVSEDEHCPECGPLMFVRMKSWDAIHSERDALRTSLHTCKVELSGVQAERDELRKSLDICRDDRKTMGRALWLANAQLAEARAEVERLKERREIDDINFNAYCDLRGLVQELCGALENIDHGKVAWWDRRDDLIARARAATGGAVRVGRAGCRCAGTCPLCASHRQSIAGAYWLGMLGFALAAPAATARAWRTVLDTEWCADRDVEPLVERGAVAFRNEALKAIKTEDEL